MTEGMGLQLFNFEEFEHKTSEKRELPVVTEEKIITPLKEILDNAVPTAEPKKVSPTLAQSLDDLFPEQQYDEKNIQKAKEILGPLAAEFTQEQLKDAVVEIQYLCETWLDEFERGVFKGQTLNELLHEKGGR